MAEDRPIKHGVDDYENDQRRDNYARPRLRESALAAGRTAESLAWWQTSDSKEVTKASNQAFCYVTAPRIKSIENFA